MTITIRNKDVVDLMKELLALTGDDLEAALGPILAAEIARRRSAQTSISRTLVFDRFLDEEPNARIERLKAMIRKAWKPIPIGKTFENPDDIIGYGRDGVPE